MDGMKCETRGKKQRKEQDNYLTPLPCMRKMTMPV